MYGSSTRVPDLPSIRLHTMQVRKSNLHNLHIGSSSPIAQRCSTAIHCSPGRLCCWPVCKLAAGTPLNIIPATCVITVFNEDLGEPDCTGDDASQNNEQSEGRHFWLPKEADACPKQQQQSHELQGHGPSLAFEETAPDEKREQENGDEAGFLQSVLVFFRYQQQHVCQRRQYIT